MDVTRVPVEGATRAPAGETNAYVVSEGSDALLVDPAARTDALDRALDAVLEDSGAVHVAVTHHHLDHVGAVAEYAEGWDATVWSRAGRESAFEAATGVAPDETFGDGTAIPVGDADPTVVETPGHAPEHVGFDVADGILVGDLAVANGSIAVAAPEGDVRAYLTSLRRIRARDPARLFPGHGPVVEDPRAVCDRLLRHRLDREARILEAVVAGADSIDAVVDRAYEKDLTGVRGLARATVEAHLEKLSVEGKVSRDGESVRPR